MDKAHKVLSSLNLRKTPTRKKVLEMFFEGENQALSSKEIESGLKNPDRITLYRTLKTFEIKGLIHQALDSTGTTKYALCSEDCGPDQHAHDHAHFHCTVCDQTVCIDRDVTIKVSLPKGFSLIESHLVLEGTCNRCIP